MKGWRLGRQERRAGNREARNECSGLEGANWRTSLKFEHEAYCVVLGAYFKSSSDTTIDCRCCVIPLI